MDDPKQRFTSRVENYIKYRPGYPPGVIDTLRAECGLSPDWRVADIGSGTGLLTRLFLDLGCRVFGVEPNEAMRAAGNRELAGYASFTSLDGSAEQTGLPDASLDLVTAGQAFHWFDPARARAEFQRILKPGGWVALVWNERSEDSTPFLREYEALLRSFGTDYARVNHRNVEEDPDTIPAFFGGDYKIRAFANFQHFDFDGAKGRLLSSSYAPEPGHPGYAPMLADLRRLFDHYQQGGTVTFDYTTRLFYGMLG